MRSTTSMTGSTWDPQWSIRTQVDMPRGLSFGYETVIGADDLTYFEQGVSVSGTSLSVGIDVNGTVSGTVDLVRGPLEGGYYAAASPNVDFLVALDSWYRAYADTLTDRFINGKINNFFPEKPYRPENNRCASQT